jgi:hypothetical protein
VKCVVRAVEKRHRATLGILEDRFPRARVRIELRPVPLTKLLPPLDSMTEPRSQRCAGRDFLHPSVDPERILPHPARPQPLDEDATTIRTRRRLVRPLDPDHARRPPFACLASSWAWVPVRYELEHTRRGRRPVLYPGSVTLDALGFAEVLCEGPLGTPPRVRWPKLARGATS